MARQRPPAPVKRIVIIAGPNGAGKTTFAREYLPREAGCPDFINVDLIAAGLSPFAPARAALQAGRVMLQEIRRRVRAGESFAFETTLAGRQYARWIPRWQAAGYHVCQAGLPPAAHRRPRPGPGRRPGGPGGA